MQPSPSRRRFLAATAAAAAGFAGCTDGANEASGGTGGTTGGTDSGGDGSTSDGDGGDGGLANLPDTVRLEPVATGFDAPVGMATSSTDDLRYVLEQSGRIDVIGPDGRLDDPVFDRSDRIPTGYETGLLGLALHPGYADNRRAFVRYSAPLREGTPDDYDHTFVLAEFAATDDGTRFRTDTERTILEIPEPQGNHNAGDLAFGPDGSLYVPVGDGGAAADQGTGHVDDWYGAVDGGNGQDVTENLLGSILRIDVDATPTEHPRTDPDAPDSPDGDEGYAIPEDNPLVGREGRDEHYAWGLRNPWQLSFDLPADERRGDEATQRSVDEVDCYVADVGQDSYEEVNLLEAGANYGWNVREGAHCFQAADCPTETPEDVRGGEPLVDPIIEYPHGSGEVSGASVIGGHVYRGGDIEGLGGAYVFGDLQPEGRLFAARRPEDGGQWPLATIEVEGASLQGLYAFGRDWADRLYALGQGSDGGTVWRLAPAE